MCYDDKTSTELGYPDHHQARAFVHLDRRFCQNLEILRQRSDRAS